MSSRRREPAAAAAAPKVAERKPPRPIFTPLNVGIVLVIIILVAIGVFWKSVYIAKTAEIDSINAAIERQRQQNEVYKKKAEMLPKAEKLNAVMDKKLQSEQKYYLAGQGDIIPFFEEWFLDILMSNGIYVAKVETEPSEIVFKLSWLMEPVETLPPIQDAVDMFKWEYVGEGSGTGEVAEKYPNFLEPLTIHLSEFTMTYEDMKRFVKALQTDATYMVTVHGFSNKSEEEESFYGFRTVSPWETKFTVYFMNPEGMTSGDVPPGMPADRSL